MTDKYVDLNRRFAPFDDRPASDDLIVRSYADSPLFSASTASWEDLLENRVTVVLGEPGSGKTFEFRNRAAIAHENGESAFFVPLERLVHESVRATLFEVDETRFDRWLRSRKKATFFLDSVDESKIRRDQDFEVALQRFARDITASGVARAKIVISSRVSEWRSAADSTVVRRILQVRDTAEPQLGNASNKKRPAELKVVRLLPLDEEMVATLLEGAGFERVSEITEQFRRLFLWPFVRRPADALRYARSVRDNRDLSNLTNILQHDICERLRETREREREDVLTPTKATAGAAVLAAAVFFTERSIFVVRDMHSDSHTNAINPVKCLPGWTASEVNSLLNRATFDAASRGTVRFHHRTVTDFLAAKWLVERADHGCPVPNIHDLLFAKQAGSTVIREGSQPIVAWIACGNSSLSANTREWILEAAPEIFLEFCITLKGTCLHARKTSINTPVFWCNHTCTHADYIASLQNSRSSFHVAIRVHSP